MLKNTDGWIGAYGARGALWLHDDNPKRPHALLTSGKHSSGFFNSELVMEDPLLLDYACADLVLLLAQSGLDINAVDRVAGPAMGAITLAHDIARHIGRVRARTCLRAYAEKAAEGDQGRMVFTKTAIGSGERILAVEDVVTTGGSVALMIEAVVDAGGIPSHFVATLVNRSGLTEVCGRRIIALIDRPMPMWIPDHCPLCAQGSEAIRPKGTANWARLAR